MWAVPAIYDREGAEAPRVVGRVADAASEWGYGNHTGVLCWGGIGTRGVEGAYFGPDAVVANKGAVSVDVVGGGDGVAWQLRFESLDFERVDEVLERGNYLLFEVFGEALAYRL